MRSNFAVVPEKAPPESQPVNSINRGNAIIETKYLKTLLMIIYPTFYTGNYGWLLLLCDF